MQTLINLAKFAFDRFFRSKPKDKLRAATLRLFILLMASIALRQAFHNPIGSLAGVATWFFAIGLLLCLVGLVFRLLFTRVLWTVRSRLIATCLLLGLAPIVLFGALGAIATYLFCGQFATSIAAERIDDGASRDFGHSAAALFLMPRTKEGAPALDPGSLHGANLPELPEEARAEIITTWFDGKRVATPKSLKKSADLTLRPGAGAFEESALPAWVKSGFKGVVAESGRLFLCGASGDQLNGHPLMVVACSPFAEKEVQTLSEGLGTVSITANVGVGVDVDDDDKPRLQKKAQVPTVAGDFPRELASLQGGKLDPALNFFDFRVYFSAPLQAMGWLDGEDQNKWLIVVSRPSVLYKRLFASSVQAGTYVRIALIATSIAFGVIELMACLMAVALSRTITRSIDDLYVATRQIDAGNLNHRIPVRRKDQLAALAGSFNSMTTSLRALLIDQREKDRMESELKVAQEVQNNLFPHSSIAVPGFELFGVCQPARTIGGDYYDFIPFGTSEVYLALGDISGKGISAALLMASLHSAVRAYRTGASSEMLAEDVIPRLEINLSPGRLLALLNEHLYSSTQASKYATLFLACYDSKSRRLTYSNGGHLPPIVLRANGSLKRLDCGGSVVGLLKGMEYAEETIQLDLGDLLIAYSDGLTEPERDHVDFGEARLIEVVRRNLILKLPDVAAHTLKAVNEWIGDTEQPDDMTLVLARLH